MIIIILFFLLIIHYLLIVLITSTISFIIVDSHQLQVVYDLLAVYYSFSSICIIFFAGAYSSNTYINLKDRILTTILLCFFVVCSQLSINFINTMLVGIHLLNLHIPILLPQYVYYLMIIVAFITGQFFVLENKKDEPTYKTIMYVND